MLKTKVKNQIYLSGGGDETQSLPYDIFFMQTIPKNGTVLYIPLALIDNKLYKTAPLWIKNLFRVHKREDVEITTLDTDLIENIGDISNFSALYIGGGNTWTLLSILHNTNFIEKIRDYITGGGIVYGGSAGAIIMGNTIKTAIDDKLPNRNIVTEGLNCINGYSIICHLNNKDKNEISNLSKKINNNIIGLLEESAIKVHGNKVTCIGKNPCTIFTIEGDIIDIQAGDIFFIQ